MCETPCNDFRAVSDGKLSVLGAFEYIKTTGVLEVTVLWCSRLNTAIVNNENSDIFCVLSVGECILFK